MNRAVIIATVALAVAAASPAGAQCRLCANPTTSVEEVTAFEPGQRLEYKLLKGLPLRNYVGEVRLTDWSGVVLGGSMLLYLVPQGPASGGQSWAQRIKDYYCAGITAG